MLVGQSKHINDILTTSFPGYEPEQKEPVIVGPEEEKVFSHIGLEKIHVDEIIERSGMKAKQVMAILTKLEMMEIIREVPGGFYIRK